GGSDTSRSPSSSSRRSPGSNTPRSTRRSYSTRFHRFIWSVCLGTNAPSASLVTLGGARQRRPVATLPRRVLSTTVDRAPRDHACEIRRRGRLDPVAARLHRPGLEAEPRARRRVACAPAVGVAPASLERL